MVIIMLQVWQWVCLRTEKYIVKGTECFLLIILKEVIIADEYTQLLE